MLLRLLTFRDELANKRFGREYTAEPIFMTQYCRRRSPEKQLIMSLLRLEILNGDKSQYQSNEPLKA